MKIVFISNFLNHHQLSLCQHLNAAGDFTFIASEPVNKDALKLGYADMNEQYAFVKKAYQSPEDYREAEALINAADVVIAGSNSFPFNMIKDRLKQDKLTFWFSERLFKQKCFLLRFYPPRVFRVLKQCTLNKNKRFYLLAAGAYAAKDYRFLGAFKNKSFKWGYFPYFEELDESAVFQQKDRRKTLKLYWAGRFLRLKRPKWAVDAAAALNAAGIDFELTMTGIGIELENVKRYAIQKNVADKVLFTGAISYQEVREHMKDADIFLFTSNSGEGWGAVLNEAMNSCCACICGSGIGSAPYLIKNGHNGLLFATKKQFLNSVIKCCGDSALRRKISQNAYIAVKEQWNAKNAAGRLLEFAGSGCLFSDGVMSKADAKNMKSKRIKDKK